MNFSRESRLARIAEILPRFPEAGEILRRYREALVKGTEAPELRTSEASVEETPGAPARAFQIPARCPACGGPPGLSVLMEEPGTQGDARFLICKRCEHDWPFPRIICTECGEEETGKLPRFQAEEIPAARIEACDSCGSYLKSIDLTRDGHAVPAVDDLATCALDLAALERGYRKAGDGPPPAG